MPRIKFTLKEHEARMRGILDSQRNMPNAPSPLPNLADKIKAIVGKNQGAK